MAVVQRSVQYDLNSGDQGDEEADDARDLERIVGRRERPVVLGGEDEVDEEDGGEGEDDAGEQDLDGERADEGGLKSEDGVMVVAA